MNLGALIAAFRRLVDDRGGYLLWTDEEAANFAVDAEQEACIRARLLLDADTPACCVVPLTAGQREATLHPAVFEIHEARAFDEDGQQQGNRACGLTACEQISPIHSRWTNGWPRHYRLAGEFQAGLRLVLDRPAPADGELRMAVYRTPLAPMYAGSGTINLIAEPEIHERHHDALPYWMARTAFLTRDSDASAADRASGFEGLFADRFGRRPDANVARKQRRHNPPIVQSAF
jgi:hypothetical protein